MSSLRARIVAFLVVAIIAVLAIATVVAVVTLGRPDTQIIIQATNRQLRLLAEPSIRGAGLPILDAPLAGPIVERVTAALRADLAEGGPPLDVIVTRSPESNGLLASVPMPGGGWVAVPVLGLRTPGTEWQLLAGYLGFLVAASIIIAILAARILTRPLTVLEEAIAVVSQDGTLPPLQEDVGPAEVRAAARAVNRLSKRLHSAMESRIRLVAAAGHDLRTPMTRMRLRTEFVADDEEREAWIRDLDELDRLADSAIALVREETAGRDSEPVRIDELAASVVDEIRGIGLPVQIGTTRPATVRVGPLALRRALRNLVINAATHGGGATVSVTQKDGAALVEIEDSGSGIPEEKLSQVFEPFFRVDPARQKVIPGAGLGLSIANEIVRRFGGSLTIRNRQSGGLSQTVALPLADPAPERTEA